MNYKNLILTVATLSGLTLSIGAEACSYYINEIQKKNELTAAAASHLQLELSVVSKNSVESFSWVESKPTPMCPEELTYRALVTLEYEDPTATFPRPCVSQMTVVKIEDWKTHISDYKFEDIQTVCK